MSQQSVRRARSALIPRQNHPKNVPPIRDGEYVAVGCRMRPHQGGPIERRLKGQSPVPTSGEW